MSSTSSSSSDATIDAIAGTTGALLALLSTYPLITINTRQHVTRRRSASRSDVSVSDDDASSSSSRRRRLATTTESLYDGIKPALIGVAASQATYNYWYSRARTAYEKSGNGRREATGTVALGLASFAGCVNVLMTLPIWTVVTKMQADVKRKDADADGKESESESESKSESVVDREIDAKRTERAMRKKKNKDGFFDIARQVIRDDGIKGLWQGLTPSLIMVSNPALQYAFYETSSRWRLRRSGKSTLSAAEVFVLGAIAKFGATMATYPLMVVKSRLQVVSKDMEDERMRYRGTLHALRRMTEEEGLGVFYKGITTKLTQTILAAALMFTVKEKLAESMRSARTRLAATI